ncbi:YdcF family protein [Bacillus sp. JJ664]
MEFLIRGIKQSKTIYLLIFLIMMALLAVFGNSFGVLFVIGNFSVLFLILTFLKKAKISGNRMFKVISQITAVIYSIFLISFFIIESFIILEAKASKKVDSKNIDFVIILGAGLHGDIPSKTLETRLEAGKQFLLKNKNLPVIVSGGQGEGETISEAKAMGRYLTNKGIAENRIYYESESTTTYENLKFSKQIIKQLGVTEPTVLIVTNDYHIVRAKMIGKELGLESFGLGGKSPILVRINYFIREYFGIVKTIINQYL